MKKLPFFVLVALLPGPAQAQLNDSLHVLFESQPGVRRFVFEDILVSSATGRLDMNGDGGVDLLLQRDDDQGRLQDLRVLDGRTRAVLWDIRDVSQTLGVASDGLGSLFGFADPDGDGEREAIFAGEQTVRLINPGDNTLSFSFGATQTGTMALVGVIDLTGDGYEEIIVYLRDTKQIQVWSKG